MPGPNRQREKAFADKLFAKLQIAPTQWEEAERPDSHFFVDGKQIGMEITESTPPENYWANDIAKKVGGGDPLKPFIYGTSNLRNHGRQRTKDELTYDMLNPSYVNLDDARKWWIKDVKDTWAKKRKKLNEPDFRKFDENWLLIWDNEGLSNDCVTFKSIDHEINTANLVDRSNLEFDCVYVLSGEYVFHFLPQGYSYWLDHGDGKSNVLKKLSTKID